MTPTERRTNDDRLREVESDVAVLKRDMRSIQGWETESRRFHQTVTTFMDTFNATQEQIRKEQAQRHRDNQDAMARLGSKISFGMFIVALLGLLFTGLGVLVAYQVGKSHARILPPLSTHQPVEARNQFLSKEE